MPDVFTKAKRSEVMSRIRSRGNKDTELALAKLFRRNKITGWRRHIQISTSPRPSPQRGEGVRVRPDFVFRQARLAIFVDGCFWHGCPKHGTQPAGNRSFWKKKFARNQTRDRLVNRALRRAGWRVLRIWEHALRQATKRQATKGKRNEARLLRRIRRALD
jgi:DNA mismatch endonuclease (patch repair protein)